jgi:hypothetical protein
MTVCNVCGDCGWLKAAPVTRFQSTAAAVPAWGSAQPIPCWACFPTRVAVIA